MEVIAPAGNYLASLGRLAYDPGFHVAFVYAIWLSSQIYGFRRRLDAVESKIFPQEVSSK